MFTTISLVDANHMVKVIFKESGKSHPPFEERSFKVTLQRGKNIVIGRFVFIFTIYYS